MNYKLWEYKLHNSTPYGLIKGTELEKWIIIKIKERKKEKKKKSINFSKTSQC